MRSLLVCLATILLLCPPALTFPNLHLSVERLVENVLIRKKREDTEEPPCGVRHESTKGGPGSLDSEETSLGEFPWMMDVIENSHNPDEPFCAGSLIRKNVVLTTASCVANNNAADLVVRGAVHDRGEKTVDPYQERPVSRIVVHEEYGKRKYINNIALLFLKRPFDLSRNINPVCLPSENVKLDRTKCLGTGWGYDEQMEKEPRIKLKKVHLPFVERKVCEQKLSDFIKKPYTVHESFICAGDKKRMYAGDGGAPLVCPMVDDPNTYVQIGLVALNIKSPTLKIGAYTSVEYMLPWINEKLSEK